MQTQSLRQLVAERLEGRWAQWSQAHPHLAEVIDRTRLIDSAVARLREDEQFIAAMQQANLDERTLKSALALLEVIERWIIRLLP